MLFFEGVLTFCKVMKKTLHFLKEVLVDSVSGFCRGNSRPLWTPFVGGLLVVSLYTF